MSFKSYLICTICFVSFSSFSEVKISGNQKKADNILNKLKMHVIDDTKKASLSRLKNVDTSENISRSICNTDEEQYQSIELQIMGQLQDAFMAKESRAITNLFSKTGSSVDFNAVFQKPSKVFKNENIKQYSFASEKASKVGHSAILDSLNTFFSKTKKMDDVSFDTTLVRSPKEMRAGDQITMTKAELTVHFDFRYLNNDQERVNERGYLLLEVGKESSDWKILKLSKIKSDIVVSKSLLFEESTSKKMSDAVPSILRREAIRRGGYALAISDYNNDGLQDMLVGTAEKVVILKAKSDGSFQEDKDSGVQNHSLVKSAAFLDLYNSGRKDLILIRFAPGEKKSTAKESSDIVVYKNKGDGKFEKVLSPINFSNSHPYAMPLAIADFNNDSFLDFYVGFPGAKDFTTLKEVNVESPNELNAHGFFFNRGDGKYKFADKTESALWRGKLGKYASAQLLYPHSAYSVDYNTDGNMDVVVIDDRNNLSPVFENKGQGLFEKSNKKIGFGANDYGMGVAFGDLANKGHLDFIMTSVNFVASERIEQSCKVNWNIHNYMNVGTRGLRVFKNAGSGQFQEGSLENGLDWVGEGLAGVELIDYNNDGFLDIYLANGLWSGSKKDKKLDISSLFVRASKLGLLEDSMNENFERQIGSVKEIDDDLASLRFKNKSQSAVMNVLSYYKDKNNQSLSLAGFQRNRLFRNNGDGTFVEMAYAAGIDSGADGYMISYADLNKRGNYDLVLRNADPGFDKHAFSPVQVYENQNKDSKSILLDLEGSMGSNRDGIGTFVKAKVGEQILFRHLTAMNGTVQSEKFIHLGLGSSAGASDIEIKWPNGSIQKIDYLKSGVYKIKQGESLNSVN